MTVVFQTRFGRGNGNCLTACVASVLDMRIEEIPEFAELHEGWFEALSKWCVEQKITILYWNAEAQHLVFAQNTEVIVLVNIPGEEELHAVVAKAVIDQGSSGRWYAEVIHDPNPYGTRTVDSVYGFLVLGRHQYGGNNEERCKA